MFENEYINSLKKLTRRVYIQGASVVDPLEHPLVRLSTAAIGRTYALQDQPEHETLIYARSHLSGRRINRFTHIHRSTEDLINKVKLQRLLGQQTGTCFQRCVGMDALNALEITTFDLERDLGKPCLLYTSKNEGNSIVPLIFLFFLKPEIALMIFSFSLSRPEFSCPIFQSSSPAVPHPVW